MGRAVFFRQIAVSSEGESFHSLLFGLDERGEVWVARVQEVTLHLRWDRVSMPVEEDGDGEEAGAG
jgi:hypothetical protein